MMKANDQHYLEQLMEALESGSPEPQMSKGKTKPKPNLNTEAVTRPKLGES